MSLVNVLRVWQPWACDSHEEEKSTISWLAFFSKWNFLKWRMMAWMSEVVRPCAHNFSSSSLFTGYQFLWHPQSKHASQNTTYLPNPGVGSFLHIGNLHLDTQRICLLTEEKQGCMQGCHTLKTFTRDILEFYQGHFGLYQGHFASTRKLHEFTIIFAWHI